MQPQRIEQSAVFFQQDDEFDSFSDDQQNMPIDQTQFAMHNQQQIILKSPSQNFQKLYNIYHQNTEIKKNLQKQINRLKELQRNRKLCVKDAQDQNLIEQYIDIQQNSDIYRKSEEQYRKRKRYIYGLQSQYRQLKVMSVQAMMELQRKTDTKFNDAITTFLKNNKQVFGWAMCKDGIVAICRENRRRRKHHIKNRDKISRQPSKDSQLSSKKNQSKLALIKKQNLNDDSLSRSRSRSNSQDSSQYKKQRLSRYSIRFLKYCEISLQTHPNYSQKIDTLFIPTGTFQPNQPIGIAINDKHIKDGNDSILQYQFIVYSENKVMVFKVDPKVIAQDSVKIGQQSKQNTNSKKQILTIKKYSQVLLKRQTIQFDSKVCLVQIQSDINNNTNLFVGTDDGIVRKFAHNEKTEGNLYNLQNLFLCYPRTIQDFSPINFLFCINENTIIFVSKQKKLYELNMDDYGITLLSELPEKVIRLTPKVLLTQTMCYTNYYQKSGKVAMIHNSELNEIIGNNLFIDVVSIEEEKYLIGLSQGNGNISVKVYDKL